MNRFLLTFFKLATALLAAVFISSSIHKASCMKFMKQALASSNPILLGDSHAAQLDLKNVHEISSEGSSLFLPLQFLTTYRNQLAKDKPLLISVWHQNVTSRSEEISNGISKPSHSLKMFSEGSTLLGLRPLGSLQTFKSKLLYVFGFLGIHRSLLDGSGTCFEGRVDNIPKPNLENSRGVHLNKSAIEKINAIASEDSLNLIWIISPEIRELSVHYAKINQQLDSLLNLQSRPNVKVLDLRELDLPLNHFRDEHHINCKPQALIDSLVREVLR